jgi:hypothetical protein
VKPGDICERRDRGRGHFVAIISTETTPGQYMAVPILVTAEAAADHVTAFHSIGLSVQGYLIPEFLRIWRQSDLHPPTDTTEAAPLLACRELFQHALEREPPERTQP